MSILKGIFKIVIKSNAHRIAFSNLAPNKNQKINVDNIVWNKPEALPFNHSLVTGDLDQFEVPPLDTIRLEFQNSEILKNASKEVKKVFSLHYLPKTHYYYIYEKQLLEKVKNHEYDNSSTEAQIAICTAKIRFNGYCYEQEKKKKKKLKYKILLVRNLNMRQQLLTNFRAENYKKFEWILEQLNIVFRPNVETEKSSRKNSLRLLATIKAKTDIENKRIALQKIFDNQKISFLEKKIEKLNWIKNTEKAYNLPSTITDEDINECMKKLEEIKISLSQKIKEGYERKIDPHSLEFYNEKLLLEKERS